MELLAPGPADGMISLRLTKSRLLSDGGGEKYLIGLRPERGYQSFMFYMQIGKDFRVGDGHYVEQCCSCRG